MLKSADCWNDLQVVVNNIRVNWCTVIGWIGEPAVLCHSHISPSVAITIV